MKKMLIFVKRKPGLSHAEFRDYYETVHAQLGARYFEGVIGSFDRYYAEYTRPFAVDWTLLDEVPEEEAPFDAVVAYSFTDDAARDRYFSTLKSPEAAHLLASDEANFLDRDRCRIGWCDASEGAGVVPGKSSLEIAEELLSAGASGDLDRLLSMFTPDATVWHNFTGAAITPAQAAVAFGRLATHVQGLHYEDVQIFPFEGGFAQEHKLVGTANGRKVVLPASLICHVSDGLLKQVHEYFDLATLGNAGVPYPW